ncbi:MAG: serine hydrolase [Alteromonadaceae bacterium]|nr:serine hydrolase [Alteromonadaceae bacterium]
MRHITSMTGRIQCKRHKALMKFYSLIFLLILATRCAGAAELNLSSATNEASFCKKLDEVTKPYVDHAVFYGELLIAKNNRVVCRYISKVSDYTPQNLVKKDLQYPIASLSKPIVAALVLKLQEIGVVDLDKPISFYLPGFTAPWASMVTLHHLLANTSGLPNHFTLPDWGSGRYRRQLPNQQLMELIANLTLNFTPGADYLYSNLGWLLIAKIVEEVTGKGLQDNLQTHLFQPLSMMQSGVVTSNNKELVGGFRWAQQGGWQPHKTLHTQVFQGGAGLYASASDLQSFVHAIHGEKLLSPASHAMLFSSQQPLGWRVEYHELSPDVFTTRHSYDGQLDGHSSLVYYFPEEELSLILLANNGIGFRQKQALADDVIATYHQLPVPIRSDLPSFHLQKSLITNTWHETLEKVTRKNIESLESAQLILELARQLRWSEHPEKAVDLFNWLVESFPDAKGIRAEFEELCGDFQELTPCRQSTRFSIGMALERFEDNDRQAWRSDKARPMHTHIFYPTESTDIKPFYLGAKDNPLFKAGNVAHNALPVSEKRPLVLMSHGTGGSAPQMLWLADALVQAGFIVAGVNHHGNTAFEAKKFPEGFLLWWERTQDLKVVRQKLLEHHKWREYIDPTNTFVVGFSLGGYTALSAIGGITDKSLFAQYCSEALDDFSCQPQPEFLDVLAAFEEVANSQQVLNSNDQQHFSFRLPHITASVAIAPAVVYAFRAESLTENSVPTLLIAGAKDRMAPSKANAEYAHALLPNSQFKIIEDAHHYSFLSQCTQNGKMAVPDLCSDPNGVQREEIHKKVSETVVAFLLQYIQ